MAPLALLFGTAQDAPGQNTPNASSVVSTALPDAPTPTGGGAQNPAQQPPSTQQTPPPAQQTQDQAQPAGQSSSKDGAQQTTPESQHEKAEEQLREQEHQRIGGIVPSFNVTYRSDAVSLTAAQKFSLDYHAAIDPYTFGIAAIVTGLSEANDSTSGFGWGAKGFAEHAAASYGDNVIGNFFGNALLPSILHQDPRYFRMGHGSFQRRFLYSAATSFICKHDNTGKWEPNYSNVLGNVIGGEISNLYTPDSGKNDFVQAIEAGFTVTFEGIFGAELQEFWPDISRKFFHKDPTHGLDALAQANDAAAKQKKKQEQNPEHPQ
ncbi:MAG TPA: hypothetical protein VMD29_05430 [Terracidiphilus sp.]|nr:hypothetical protein [Terracidiphilus sp.]